MDVSNLIPSSSAFSKSSLNIWKFSVHVLLKPSLKDLEHYLASMWNEHNCVIVWTFFGIALLWDWNEHWSFPVLWSLLSFPNLLAYWVQHFNSIIFWELKLAQLEFHHLPLALFVVLLPKAHLTSHSRISGSRWVITPLWLSKSLRPFLYSPWGCKELDTMEWLTLTGKLMWEESMQRVGPGWWASHEAKPALITHCEEFPHLCPHPPFSLPRSSLLSWAWEIFGSIFLAHSSQAVIKIGFLPPILRREGRWLSWEWASRFSKFYEMTWKLLLWVAEALSYHATLLSASSVIRCSGSQMSELNRWKVSTKQLTILRGQHNPYHCKDLF